MSGLPSNPLTRITAVLEKMQEVAAPAGNAPLDAWGRVFSELSGGLPMNEYETVRCLAMLGEEVVRADELLAATRLPAQQRHSVISRVHGIVTVGTLRNGWTHIVALISPDLFGLVLSYGSLVHSGETLIPDESLEAIYEAVAALEREVSELVAGHPLRGFFEDRIAELRWARLDYAIAGAGAFRRAAYEFDGAMVNVAASAATSDISEREALGRVFGAAVGVSQALKTALKTAGFVVALASAAAGASQLGETAAGLQQYYLNAGDPHLDGTLE